MFENTRCTPPMMSSQRRHDGTDQNVQLGEDGGNASNAQDAHQLQDPQTSQGARFGAHEIL